MRTVEGTSTRTAGGGTATASGRTATASGTAPGGGSVSAGAPVGATASAGAPKGDTAAERRRELAAFLRSRRERITPEQVGLARGPRRRTPGLRREEVATLAAVGVTWYTWLEQARDIQVSAQVLDAVARALLLDPHERRHVFGLAHVTDPAPGTRCPVVTDAVRAMLDQLEPLAACVQNSRYDILAHNRVYGLMLCDLEEVAPEDRNCMVLSCVNEEWRDSFSDGEGSLRVMAAKFRSAMADHLDEPAYRALHARLMRNPQFRAHWERQEIIDSTSRTKHFRNRHVGLLTVIHTDLWLGPSHGPRLVTYTPADAETRRRMERLREMSLEREARRAAERGADREADGTEVCAA
ncbi:putative DNA-binding protein [Streptomyces sp. Tu6071]|uniref:helix-turn-helix transcriptional regulator n=1 Tax=Streptomyces sp. Tu6071 TaxID=355249 RepID=UPI00020E5ED7|nr:helix-turn-helix transcriptional regulator [Streptomyces sp. Tu6071]EGJ77555.1 putative DNA-binding protein [Streptomyces sp. Tu6071]